MNNVFIKEHFRDNNGHKGDFFWKFLCTTSDNEGLGFLERLLKSNQIEHKIEEAFVPAWDKSEA